MTEENNIFNSKKTDYDAKSIFLGEKKGLVDTIHSRHPKIWELYKTLKSQDWDETEFDFSSCNVDFKNCDPTTYDAMIFTLAWQWEADSVVAHSIAPLVAPLINSDEVWCTWLKINENENIHALTYSEIVRCSFDNPETIIDDILKVRQSLDRLDVTMGVLEEIYNVSHKYALGLVEDNQETYNVAFKLPIALLFLERIQFIASFAVTFAITETGVFTPIGKAVEKIAQDELEIHSEVDKLIIQHEMGLDRGKIAYEETKAEMNNMLNEIVIQECEWSDFLFSEGREILGLTPDILKRWVGYNAKHVYDFMNYTPSDKVLEVIGGSFPDKNPLKFMEYHLDLSKIQSSPQEEQHGAYRVSVLQRDDDDFIFDVNF